MKRENCIVTLVASRVTYAYEYDIRIILSSLIGGVVVAEDFACGVDATILTHEVGKRNEHTKIASLYLRHHVHHGLTYNT